MWPAVDENEQSSYGKTIEKTKLKPVFVEMIAPEDIEATLRVRKENADPAESNGENFSAGKGTGRSSHRR